MAQFRVLQKSFIGNSIVNEGDIVEYDGEPSDNLEPVRGQLPRRGRQAEAPGPADATDADPLT